MIGSRRPKQIDEPLEERVADELSTRGWRTARWGRGILPPDFRSELVGSSSNLRHFPDLVAAQHGEVVAVDCKSHLLSTENGRYAICNTCVSFGLQFRAAFGIPMFYVFGDLRVMTPVEVLAKTPTVTGSYLVNARLAHPFDDIFGPVIFHRTTSRR